MKVTRIVCDGCDTPLEEGSEMTRVLMERVRVQTVPRRGRAPKPKTKQAMELCDSCIGHVAQQLAVTA